MTVRVRPEARLEIIQTAQWFEEREPGLGAVFVAELDAALKRLELRPEQYQIIYRKMRRALMRRFPNAIYFEREGTGVIVFAVLHQRRDRKILDER